MFYSAILLSLNALGTMALCTLVYGRIQKTTTNRTIRHMLVGVTMGIGAATLMMHPLDLGGGFLVDGRNAFIGVAATFGGPISAAFAVIIAAFTRITIGGGGAMMGCLAMFLTAVVASLWTALHGPRRKRSLLDWCSLSAVCTLPLFLMLTAPIPNREQMMFYLMGLTAGTIVIFGQLMETEQRRGRRERELNAAANTDALTLLPNRRMFLDVTQMVEERAQKRKGLLLIDIDHFKRINDTLGHDAGDEVLRVVGRKLAEVTRKSDVAARFGGEEFVLLVNAESQTDLANMAGRVREALHLEVAYKGKSIPLSVSIGGSFFGENPFSFQRAYSDADRSLYSAKEQGRDMSVITGIAA